MDMDFRCLSILFSLNLILMTAHATLPPQIYWERMLPSTPMPKTIVELLNHGGCFSTGHMEKATNDYQKVRIIDLEKSFDMQLEDEFPVTCYAAKKWGNSIDKQLEDDFPATWYGANKWEKSIDEQLEDDFPVTWYGAKKLEKSIDKELEDDFPITWYGTKKWGKSIDKQLEDEFPLSWYGPEKGLSQDIIPSSYTYHKKSKPSPKTLSHNDANLHDHPKGDLIFMVEGLHPGSKLDAHFYEREIKAPLLPRQVAQRIPFSSKKMKEILDIFSVQPGSEIAEVVAKNIQRCEVPLSNGEEKHCATSLESMVDFITSRLGNKNVLAISTEVERETRSRKFIVKDGVKNLAYENVIACHPMNYPPHVVFFCHHLLNTTTHFVPLVGEEDGVRVKAVAICHRDTSTWDPNHVAFQVLKIKPGDAPVCHILPLRHFMFTK